MKNFMNKKVLFLGNETFSYYFIIPENAFLVSIESHIPLLSWVKHSLHKNSRSSNRRVRQDLSPFYPMDQRAINYHTSTVHCTLRKKSHISDRKKGYPLKKKKESQKDPPPHPPLSWIPF